MICCSSKLDPPNSPEQRLVLTVQTFRTACEVWKHAICYGFGDARDSSIPDVFVCYHCRAEKGLAEASLQPEKEAEITHALAELRSLTLFRRGAFRSTPALVPLTRLTILCSQPSTLSGMVES